MPKISRHSYDIAEVAVRRDHTSGISVLKVYRPWELLSCPRNSHMAHLSLDGDTSSTNNHENLESIKDLNFKLAIQTDHS